MSAIRLGNLFVHQGVGSTVSQIFSPSSNTAGAVIRTACMVAGNGSASGTTMVLYADTAAPTGYSDITKRAFFEALAYAGSDVTVVLPYEVEIRAGWGLWAVADASNWGLVLTYDLFT